jgi:3-deoxy-D-manno-octulosonic-acid transferase/heptosyltransferase-1
MNSDSAIPEKILIVKLSAIGDVVQALPMFTALRRNFPRAEIEWLVEEDAAGILRGYPGLNNVIVSRRKTWQKGFLGRGRVRSTLREIRSFLRELRHKKYDWVIDIHGIFKSGLLVALSRGRRKIGYRATPGISDEGNYFFTRERYKPLSIETHALERYLDLAGNLGVPIAGIPFEFPVSQNAVEAAQKLLKGVGFPGGSFVILHPVAKWETKQWPEENFAKLADSLVGRGVRVVMTGSPGDVESVEGILSLTHSVSGVFNLTGKTGLKELAALFSLSDLVITPDTGPMHLAAAVKAPVVALFGPTAPWRTGPYGPGHRVLRKELPCSPCFRKKCPTRECMEQITVEEVFETAIEKLSGKGERNGS